MIRSLSTPIVCLVSASWLLAQPSTNGTNHSPVPQYLSPIASNHLTLQNPQSDSHTAPTMPPEPVPSYRIPVPAHGMIGTPPLPPHAWPTYAPYNNYSRVAYPICYPYEAFPYFGPFYPFPKVPLGWRAVKLEWNDGFWFLSTHGQRYDYWVLRFW
ncbi:MAG: hypothetical protein RMI91_02115 [Gemmatales bacterium]|nr:hypothetical protein [Gemmatales bacterium]MDW7993422.1 hypothetical protein [Gemmatales bacterium]